MERLGAGVAEPLEWPPPARLADRGKTFVQQPNGLVEKGGRPEPGAVVVVPDKPAGERGFDFLQLMGALGPLISAATTIIVVLATTGGSGG